MFGNKRAKKFTDTLTEAEREWLADKIFEFVRNEVFTWDDVEAWDERTFEAFFRNECQ